MIASNLEDAIGMEAGSSRMLADLLFGLSNVDGICLVLHHIAVEPLNLGAHFFQDAA